MADNNLTRAAGATGSGPAGYDGKAGMPSAMASKVSAPMPSRDPGLSGAGGLAGRPNPLKEGKGTGPNHPMPAGSQTDKMQTAPLTPVPDMKVQLAESENPVRNRAKPFKV